MSISASLIQPVWKYKEWDIKAITGLNDDTLRFRIIACVSGADRNDRSTWKVIYEGVAASSPEDTSAILVSINDIVADFLSAPFQGSTGGRWHTQQFGMFFGINVFDTDSNQWSEEDAVFFYKDYSYDYDFAPATMGFAHPVTGIAAPNQWLVCSMIDVEGVEEAEFELTYADGTSDSVTVSLRPYADFNEDFNADFATQNGVAALAGYAALYLGGYSDLASVQVSCGSIVEGVYSVRQDTCKRYCLYYRNAYGGWDSVLLDGVTRKEGYTRSTIGRWVDNSERGDRGSENYRNGVAEGWELHINNLTDTQAARMHHLVGSTDVYLCDLTADTLTPLNLTDAECVDKTFRNQGRKRVDYVLTAVTAQDRTRR